MNVQPYIFYKESVVLELQKPPYGYIGKTAYQVKNKYKDMVHECWMNNVFPELCAKKINNDRMSKSQKIKPINFSNPTICKKVVFF